MTCYASRLRRLIEKFRADRRSQGGELEQGFTLIELLVVLVIMPMIIGAVAIVMITTFKAANPNDPEGTFARLADAHDAQITSSYVVRDIQSAQTVSTSSQRVCSSPTDSTADQLLGLTWSAGSSAYAVTYAAIRTTSPPEFVRDLCIGGTYSNTSVVSHDVFKSVSAAGLVSCGGIGSGFSSCAGDTGSGATYAAVKVVCNNGTVTCANGGSYPVTSTFTDGKTTSTPTSWTSQSAAFSPADQGQPINGAFIPLGTTIASVTNATAVVLSQSTTGVGSGLSFQLPKRGINSVVVIFQESQSGFSYSVTGTPRKSNIGGGSATSAPFYPPFLSNGPVNVNNCQFVINGIAAVNNGGSITVKNAGSISDTGTYTAGITSPYAGLLEPPQSHLPPSYPYPVVSISTSNWDPSVDPTYWISGNPGQLKPGIYVISNGLDISKGLSTPQGVLFYVTGGSVTLGGNGNLILSYLNPYWENPQTVPPPPTTPEPVLWISASDTSPNNPPQLTLNGNGNVDTINGAIYAPTASLTINGGGSTGGINATGFTVGSVSSCNGGGSHTDLIAGSPLASGTVDSPQTSSITLGTSDTDSIVVQGQGSLPPTGTVAVYVCGPYSGPSSCTSSTNGVQSVGTATLQTGSGGTSTATSSAFKPAQTGTWCFAAYYQGSASYNPSSDTTSDGCFSVTAPALPPSPTFTYPKSLNCYYKSNTQTGCSLWAGSITGSATDPTGPGITSVSLQIQGPDGNWWTGTKWSKTQTSVQATLSGPSGGVWSWSYSFPSGSFESGKSGQGTYTIYASSTDAVGTSSPASLSFTWDG